jgi:hypothetical protein
MAKIEKASLVRRGYKELEIRRAFTPLSQALHTFFAVRRLGML